MSNEQKSLGQQVGSFLDGLMGKGQSDAAPAPKAGEPSDEFTIRYSTESAVVSLSEHVGRTIRQWFEDHAEDLGMPRTGKMGIRSGGEPVSSDSIPVPGRTYVASIERETKGN